MMGSSTFRKGFVLASTAILVCCMLVPAWAQAPQLRLSEFVEDPPQLKPLGDG